MSAEVEHILRKWHTDDPKRLVGRGHPAGDFLEAYEWEVLEREKGRLRVRAHLPDQVKNPRGTLFGGFTPTYVDFVALHAFHTARDPDEPRRWLSTASLSVEYLAPIEGPEFEILAEVLHRRGRSGHVMLTFFDMDGNRTALSNVTLIQHRA